MPALGQKAIDIDSQRAPAVQNCRWKESSAALLDALLQFLLHEILLFRRQRPHPLRQVTKTANRRFNFAHPLKIRQLVETSRQVSRQFKVPLDGFGVATLAHRLKSHPKLQSV